jgi:hypothetical protein
MQGFLFSKPVPAEDVPDLLAAAVVPSPPLQPGQVLASPAGVEAFSIF